MEKYLVEQCPVGKTAQLLRSQWTYPLMVELKKNPARFLQLKQALSPITNKTLAACLQKTASAGITAKVDEMYKLSQKGGALLAILKRLIDNPTTCNTCSGHKICTQEP